MMGEDSLLPQAGEGLQCIRANTVINYGYSIAQPVQSQAAKPASCRLNPSYQRDGMRPLFQQGTYPCDVLWQHSRGPLGGGQFITAHPAGQLKVEAAASFPRTAFRAAFRASMPWAEPWGSMTALVWVSGAACVACADDGWADGASPAQAGTTTIKALKNSSMFFMVHVPSLWLKNIHGLPGVKRVLSANNR